MDKKEVTILLVEDNEIDVKVVKRGFKKLKISNDIYTAIDGVEALEKLKAGEIPAPYIVLMDINMPRMDGIECIKEIRNDKKLNHSIIFMLTTSNTEEDKLRAYDLNIAGYIVKSDVANGFLNAIDMLEHYWKVVELPSPKRL